MNLPALLIATICICHLLAGCTTVGPDYVEPALDAPASWQAAIDRDRGLSDTRSDPEILAEWWTLLDDPLLSSFIHQAIDDNLDLEQARLRLLAARARRDISSASLLPGLDFAASISRTERGGSGSTLYAMGFDAGWELDLFGGGRRSVEAAQAEVEASREELRDVLVALTAEVALNYIEVRTSRARLRIALANLAAQEETFDLTEARYQGGLTDELALQQAKYLISGTRAQIPGLRTGLVEAENRLAILLGRPPGSLHEQLRTALPVPNLPPSIAVGIPADTLRRRPDIRKAERQLAAQTARVGVATAELYPSFRLRGSVGLDALSLGKLFDSGSRSSAFGPGVSWPIFDAGAIRANIDIQSALQAEALAKYRAVVLTALEEVENVLTAYANEQERNQALHLSAKAAGQAAELAEIQYQAGLVNFTEVLDARRSLLSFEDQMTQSTGTMTLNLIRLYKALGGGWSSFMPETATSTRK
jgi:NodT family efflux transporter outer membrane factor (OMF) lipoprotein